MERPTVAALDVGGTKLDAGVLDDSGLILARCRHRTEGVDAEALFDLAATMVEQVIEEAGTSPVALGVGCGGPMSAPHPLAPRGGAEEVSPLNIPQWRGFPLRGRLADRLAVATRVDNDAKALALGEGRHGAAQGRSDYLAMVVSTGVGGGIVVDGRLLDGAAGNAGHIGHLVVVPGGRRCPCGARGCLEAEVSGTSIAQMTGAPAAQAPSALRRRAGRLVGRAVGSVCNLLDLPLAVVAGSVAFGFGDEFFSEAQAELDRVARLEFVRGARIVPGGCGADGPLLGAAEVGWDLLARTRVEA